MQRPVISQRPGGRLRTGASTGFLALAASPAALDGTDVGARLPLDDEVCLWLLGVDP
jgi:hypothetical protein